MAPGDTNSTPSTTCRHPWRRSIQSSTSSSTSTTITDHTEPLAEKPQPTILHNEQPMRPTRLICHEPGHGLAAAHIFPHVTRPGSPRGLNEGGLKVSRRLTKLSLALAKANAQAGVDAALTIAARTQGLLALSGGGFEKGREAQLMVQEKVDAAGEGAFAAQAAWGAFWIKAAFGGVRTPHDVSAGLTAIAEGAAG